MANALSSEALHNAKRALPKGILVRRGRAEDEQGTFDVMRRAMGYDSLWEHHAEARNHLRESPNVSFWVAEDTPRFSRPRVVGYARSVVREKVWSLTEFFVSPDFQNRGVGGAILAHTLEEGIRAGAEERLILASILPSAQALYIRAAGCFPQIPMLLLAGPTNRLRLELSQQHTVYDAAFPSATPFGATENALVAEPISLTREVLEAFERLDRQVLGYARNVDHALWGKTMGGRQGAGRLFRRPSTDSRGEIVGYAYTGTHSNAPMLALDPNDLPRMMYHIAQVYRYLVRTRTLTEGVSGLDTYCPLAGTNTVMLGWLLGCGWRITFEYVLMSSRPLGQLDRYVGYTPLYLL